MKKNILVLLVALFGFSNMAWSDPCLTPDGITTVVTGTTCSAEPDFIQYKIYEMGICTAAPVAPTTSAKMDLTSCVAILKSTTGFDVSVTKGATSNLDGDIIRPDNGTYTHGYVRVSKTVLIGDSREYQSALNDDVVDGTDGEFCATTTTAQNCANATVTAANLSATFKFGYAADDIATLTGSSSAFGAYLLDGDERLVSGTGASSNATYLIGSGASGSAWIVTDATTSMDASFKVSEAMSVSISADSKLFLGPGPFVFDLTINQSD